MNTHLTDQQLIDYQFDLASEPEAKAARTHLEKCDTCRRRLHGLARKFGALELLRDDVKASRELLSGTIRNAQRAGRWRKLLLYRLPWMGAVAAAVIVGIALLAVPDRTPKDVSTRLGTDTFSFSKSVQNEAMPEDEPAVVAGAAGRGSESLMMEQPAAPPLAMAPAPTGARAGTEGSVHSVPARAYPETPRGVTANALAAAPQTSPSEEIDEQPPFAPASAIELVVLPRRENVQLTIYNAADLTLVRERRNLTLKRGWNWLQFMWANTLIDPTSLSLEPLEHKDRVEVQQLVFPPRLKDLGRWLIRSEVAGQVPFELTYFTSGLSWRAFYMGTLSQDEKTMRLQSYVRVNNNSGEDYEDAQTRLVVGRIHLIDDIVELARREYPYGGWFRVPVRDPNLDPNIFPVDGKTKWIYDDGLRFMTAYLDSPKEIVKEGLSEYFLYTIEGTETISNEWGKRLLSLEADDIPVVSLCKYDEERWGGETIRFLSFANDKEHKLGETPLPDGAVRVYGQADEWRHLSYVGDMDVKYIPVGDEVELELGPARLVEVKPVLTEAKTDSFTFDDNRNIAGWDEIETWEIKLTNARDIPADLEITRGFGTASWELVLDDSASASLGGVEYTRHDATHARFKTHLPSRAQGVIRYTVAKHQGTRSELLAEREKERSR